MALERKRNEQLSIENTDLKYTVKLAATTPVANNTVKIVAVKDQDTPPAETNKLDYVKKKKNDAEQSSNHTRSTEDVRQNDEPARNKNTTTRNKRFYEDDQDNEYNRPHSQQGRSQRHMQHRDEDERFYHEDYAKTTEADMLPVVRYMPPGINPNRQHGFNSYQRERDGYHNNSRYDSYHNNDRYGYHNNDLRENRWMTPTPPHYFNERFRGPPMRGMNNRIQYNGDERLVEQGYQQGEEQRPPQKQGGGIIFGNQNANFSGAEIYKYM